MAKKLKVSRNGEWTVLTIEGNPKNPEASHAGMIKFPGGNVNVTRTTDGNYWVHICVNRPEGGFHIPGETITKELISGRVDVIGEGVKSLNPNTDHLAFLIGNKQTLNQETG